jgi:hypothetical protein
VGVSEGEEGRDESRPSIRPAYYLTDTDE